MELQLIRIRRLPRAKTRFMVDLRIGGRLIRTRARVQPRFANSIEFAEEDVFPLLVKTGRKARYLCGAIVAAYRGEKLRLPMAFSDYGSSPPKHFRLTVNTPQEAAPLVQVG